MSGESGLVQHDFRAPIDPKTRAQKIINAIDSATADRPGVWFRPGYTGTNERILTTWPEVMSAIASAPCPITVFVDMTDNGSITYAIPAGTYDMLWARIERRGLAGNLGAAGGMVEIEIPAGSQLRNLQEVRGNICITGNATALVPSLDFDPTDAPDTIKDVVFRLVDNGRCSNLGAGAMISIDPAVIDELRVQIVRSVGWIKGAGAGAFIDMKAGGAVLLVEAHRWQLPATARATFVTCPADGTVGITDDGTVQGPILAKFTGINLAATVTWALWHGTASTTALRPTVVASAMGAQNLDTDLQRPIVYNGTEWIGAETTKIILRPAAVAGADPQVVTTWAAVMTRVAASAVPLLIQVDPTGAGGVTIAINAAVHDLKGATIERYKLAGSGDNGGTPAIILDPADGAQLKNLRCLRGHLMLRNNNTGATSLLDWDASAAPDTLAEKLLVLEDDAVITSTVAATKAVVSVAAGGTFHLTLRNTRGFLKTGAAACVFVDVAAGGGTQTTFILDLQNCRFIDTAAAPQFMAVASDASDELVILDDGTSLGPIRANFTAIGALAVVTHKLFGNGGACNPGAGDARPAAMKVGVMTVDKALGANGKPIWAASLGPDVWIDATSAVV